jgi:hypothetical protein
MQRSWVMAFIVASGLMAQDPTPAPPQVPPAPQAPEVKQDPKPEMVKEEAKPAMEMVKPSFDQLRPTQRKMAYGLYRAAIAAHELGYVRNHPKALELKETLESLLKVKSELPEKAQTAIPAVENYLSKFYANQGPYAGGTKTLMEGSFKDLMRAAQAARKAGAPGMERQLAKFKGLLFDAKADASAPSWEATPEPTGKKKRRVKANEAPYAFIQQRMVVTYWLKKASLYIENVRAEMDVKGEKKMRSVPNPVSTKAVNDLITWLDREDELAVLRDPAMAAFDLRRMGDFSGIEKDPNALGNAMLALANSIASSKAPEGAASVLPLIPRLEPVLGESKFDKGGEDGKRATLSEVKLAAPAVSVNEQMLAFGQLGRSREWMIK